MSCEIIDRLGGTPFNYSAEKHYKQLEKFRKKVKWYEILKREFFKNEKIADLERDNSSERLAIDDEDEEEEGKKQDSDLEEDELLKKYNALNFKT